MRRIAVFAATTDGPVRIERITRERAPQSMVCLKRTSTILPISAAYDSFVRPGSGVIERAFGPFEDAAFRLDISAPIDTGLSWQLGVFVAHAVAAADGVSLSRDDEADEVVWLTGAVDCDLALGSVAHIAEKVHASSAALAAWATAGKRVTMFVCAGLDQDEATSAGIPRGVKLVGAASASDVLNALDLPKSGAVAVTLPAIWKPVQRALDLRLLAGFGALIAAYLVAAEWVAAPTQVPATQSPAVSAAASPAQPLPAPAPIELTLMERRAPPGHTCAQVQFGRVTALETPIAHDGASTLEGLCGLSLVVESGAKERFVALDVDVLSGRLLYGTERPAVLDGRTAFNGRQQWLIDLPRQMDQPFELRAVAISADQPTSGAAARLNSTPDPVTAARELGSEGFGIALLHHRVLP